MESGERLSADFFVGELGGDPIFLQHLLWYFGHPEIWIALILVAIVVIAAIKIAIRLWKSGKKIGSTVFGTLFLAMAFGYIGLAMRAQALYVSGEAAGLVWWLYAQYFFLILSLFAVVWICFDWFKQRR